jgi:hypothetical protein
MGILKYHFTSLLLLLISFRIVSNRVNSFVMLSLHLLTMVILMVECRKLFFFIVDKLLEGSSYFRYLFKVILTVVVLFLITVDLTMNMAHGLTKHPLLGLLRDWMMLRLWLVDLNVRVNYISISVYINR